VDLSSIVGGDGTAWVGFTASTGAGYENHDVLSWKFSSPSRGQSMSNVSIVDSSIEFAPVPCLPGRILCTLERAFVQEKGQGQFHVYLPANLEWGAVFPKRQGPLSGCSTQRERSAGTPGCENLRGVTGHQVMA
jgi:hypothetical protein